MDVEKLCMYCMREKEQDGDICGHCGHSTADCKHKPHQLELMTILHGRYLLGRVLGEGGFGITYLAMDLVNECRVAIKELFIAGKVSRDSTNTVLLDRSNRGLHFYNACKEKFLQEAYVLQTMKDKNGIVSILDFFEENATAYIVMEYLEGEDLGAYLKNQGGRIPYQEAFRILRPVMKSMIGVNQAGIIHRDISPDNIRHLNNGRMKLMDFGSARQIADSDNSNTFVLIKQGYAPQEQYRVDYMVGPWMDVYSMSATFYRCITGKKPKTSIDRRDDWDLEMPSSLGVQIPEKLVNVLYKGLALKPENRYPDMWSLYRAMKEACMPEVKPPEPSPPIEEEKSGINKRVLFIVLLTLSIVLVICLLFFYQVRPLK